MRFRRIASTGLLVLAALSASAARKVPDISALRAAADSLFAEGWFHAADSVEARIAAVTPDEPRMLRRRATLALLDDRLPDARALLERALAKAPDDSATQAQLALACYRADAFPRASELYGEVGRAALSAKLKSFGGLEPYRISGDTASVPFVHTDPLPLIQARVNGGEPVYLLIDTGGAELILDSTYAATIGARRFGRDTGTFAGGQRGSFEHGRVDSLALGTVTVHDLPVHLMDTKRYAAAGLGLPVSGILGTTVLRHFVFTLDYPAGRLRLRPRGRPEAAADTGITMPFWMGSDHLMLARGALGQGPPVLWFVDTGLAGAAFTCPEATLREAGLPTPADTGMEGTGGGGRVKVMPFSVPRLTLGGAEARNLLGFLGPFPAAMEHGQGYHIAGIVSHGFLRLYAVTFDFDRMRMTLARGATAVR